MNLINDRITLSVIGGQGAGKTMFMAGLAAGKWKDLSCGVDGDKTTVYLLGVIKELSRQDGGIAPKTLDPTDLALIAGLDGHEYHLSLSDYPGEDFHGEERDVLFNQFKKDADGVFLLLNPGMASMNDDQWPGLSTDIKAFLRTLEATAKSRGHQIPVALITTASDRFEPNSAMPLTGEEEKRFQQNVEETWSALLQHKNLMPERFRVTVARPVEYDPAKLRFSDGDGNSAKVPMQWMIRTIRKQRIRLVLKRLTRFAAVAALFAISLGLVVRESCLFRDATKLKRIENDLADYCDISDRDDPLERVQEEEVRINKLTDEITSLEGMEDWIRHRDRRLKIITTAKEWRSKHVLALISAKLKLYQKEPGLYGTDTLLGEIDVMFDELGHFVVEDDQNDFEQENQRWVLELRDKIRTGWCESSLKKRRDSILNDMKEYSGRQEQDGKLRDMLERIRQVENDRNNWAEFIKDKALIKSIDDFLEKDCGDLRTKFREDLTKEWSNAGKDIDKSEADRRISVVFQNLKGEKYYTNFIETYAMKYKAAITERQKRDSQIIQSLRTKASQVVVKDFSDIIYDLKNHIQTENIESVSSILAQRFDVLLKDGINSFLDHYVTKNPPILLYYINPKTEGSERERDKISTEYEDFRNLCGNISGTIDKWWKDATEEKNLDLRLRKLSLWKPLRESHAYRVASSFCDILDKNPNDSLTMPQRWVFDEIDASSTAKAGFNPKSNFTVSAYVESYLFEHPEDKKGEPDLFTRSGIALNSGAGAKTVVKAGSGKRTVLLSTKREVLTNPWKLLVIHIDIDGPATSGMDRGEIDFRLFVDNGIVKAVPIKVNGSIEKISDIRIQPTKINNKWRVDVTHRIVEVSIWFTLTGEDPNHLWNCPTKK